MGNVKIIKKADWERRNTIAELEVMLKQRQEAHGILLATGASEAEIDEVKDEIALILAELGGLYDA